MPPPTRDSAVSIRPKLAWRVGPAVIAVLLVVLGRTLADVVVALMLLVVTAYAWTASVVVFSNRIEKVRWLRTGDRVPRPVTELEYIQVSAIARRAVEIGPIGTTVLLELGFWNRAQLRALVRELMNESTDHGDALSQQRLARYAGVV
jgi:hypothetical protein